MTSLSAPLPGAPALAESAGDRLPAERAEAASERQRAERQAEDVRLVERSLGGDGEAFRHLVEKYQQAVFWIANDVLLDADEARDVVQETFLRVHGALSTFDPRRDFLNWLYRIARNLSIDALRRRRRRAAPMEDLTSVPAADAGDAAARDEVRRRVESVLAELPVEYRLALTLREILGLSPRDIAAITDASYPTARWRLHRARLLFRKLWEDRFGRPSLGPSSD